MADKDQGLVTFYNDDEGWNFTAPIKPLLSNAVISAMLTGEFREVTTKRIQVPDFPRSVVERFVQDLTNCAKLNDIQTNAEYAEHVQLARLAHRFDAEQLVTAYLRTLLNFADSGRSADATLYYESCKVVFDLSAKDFYTQASRLIAHRMDLLFENDDDILLKSLCDENAKKESTSSVQGFRTSDIVEMRPWIASIARHKAYRCLKTLLDYLPHNSNHDLTPFIADLTMSEDMILKLLETHPKLRGNFVWSHNVTGVGVTLRQFPEEYNLWVQAFRQGFMEIIKFAPKGVIRNDENFPYALGDAAIQLGWINCVEYLLEQGWKPTPTALCMAVSEYQNSTLVKMLLKHVKPDSKTISAISLQNDRKVYDPERWACIGQIEKAALDNALESDLYKIYSKSS